MIIPQSGNREIIEFPIFVLGASGLSHGLGSRSLVTSQRYLFDDSARYSRNTLAQTSS